MKTKVTSVFLILTAFFIASCNYEAKKENEELRAEVAMLAKENSMLAEGNFELERSVETYHNMLKEIDQQISTIDAKHLLVKDRTSEIESDEEIEQDILLHLEHMHHMMENSKHKIVYMSNTIDLLRKDNQADHEQIHKMDIYINDLAHLVVKRDHQIEALHQELQKKGANNAAIYRAYKKQQNYSDLLLEIINSAFYFAGTKKELQERGIIDMEGGFIGIGQVKMLNANAPVELFEPIDMRQTKNFNLPGRKANIITPHPTDSYVMNQDPESRSISLDITNGLKFWQETNFLVVEVID